MKAVPLPELLVPTGGPGGAPPASMAAGEDRESFGLGHRRMKWEQSKGAVRLPAAFGVSERGVAPPPHNSQDAVTSQEQPEGPVPAPDLKTKVRLVPIVFSKPERSGP